MSMFLFILKIKGDIKMNIKNFINSKLTALYVREQAFEKAHPNAVKWSDRISVMMAALIVSNTFVQTVFAASEATNIVKNIIDAIMTMFPVIGVVLMLVGGFKLFMAFRNNQPDSYSDAAKDIVIGGILIGFKALIWSGGANLRSKISM